MRPIGRPRAVLAFVVCLVGLLLSAPGAFAQGAAGPDQEIQGSTSLAPAGITETVAEIMARDARTPASPGLRAGREAMTHAPKRDNPEAPAVSQWPPLPPGAPVSTFNPQTVGTQFLGAQVSESGFVPPDSMGAVGPTQVLVIANGRIKVFSKLGVLGALNASTDVFFASVLGGSSMSDPRARFDRLTNRWFISAISVATPNRVMLAMSSGPTIVDTTSFTFFQFQHDLIGITPNTDTGGLFDYDTLGVDNNALYIGGNIFIGNTYNGTTGFVIQKSSAIAGGPLVVTAFRQLATGSGAGPYTPQGVDNDDPAATQGYFIGVDNVAFSLLQIRRVSNPGSGSPTISGNLSLTVPTTQFPRPVNALGVPTARPLDALDDRLFMAQIKSGTLWTVHNINVTNAGIATTNFGVIGRDAARWYQINNLATTPVLVQSGTWFDNTTVTSGTARHHWIPSLAVTGQGHVAIGASIGAPNNSAGTQIAPSVVVAGRLSGDTLGTIQADTLATTGFSGYNIGFDSVCSCLRWGDYSFVSVDPNDNMSVWTFQEYVNANNSWAVRAVQLLAPPPATPSTSSPATVNTGLASASVTITGLSTGGSGFYDPGAGFPNHISATANPATVNSTTYIDPTHIALNLNTTGAPQGPVTVVVTNPDGQTASSGSGIITLCGPTTTPTVTAGGPTTFCAGGSVLLTSSSAVANQWNVNGNPIPGATGTTYTATASGDYSVTYSNACSFTATSATTTVTVVPNPPTPTITTSGSTTFCEGQSVTLTSSNASGNQWYRNGTLLSGETGTTYVATTSGNYSVTTTASGCSSSSTNTTVTVNPIPATPTVNVGGPATFCAGGSVTLTSSSATGNQWYVDGNPIGGATNQTYAANATGSYTVIVTSLGCASAPSGPVDVTVNPIPATPTINAGGPTTFCAGGFVTLTSSSATGNQWYVDGNPIGGAINATYDATAAGSYTVVVTSLGCSSASSAGTSVTVNPIPATPTINAGGPTTFCAGGSVTLTSSSAPAYQWFLNGNPIDLATNQTYDAAASGDYTVVVSSLGCPSAPSAATTVTVNPIPATPTINAGGPTTFCDGDSVMLMSSSVSGNQWYLNGTLIDNATDQSFTASASGDYSVVVTLLGCSSAASAPATVTVNPIPATPTVNAGGPTTFCDGGSVTLTSSSATGNQWYRDGTLIDTATDQTFNATTSGDYTVVVTALGCPSAPSAATTVTVNPIPATPTINAGGPTTFCEGGSVTLTSSSASGNQWYLNGNPIGSATGSSYVATLPGNYTVVVTLLGCSSASSAATTVTVNPIPSTPTITAGGPTTFCQGGSVTLTSSSASGNQWYLNGVAIGSATNQTYNANASGNYTVVVTILGCSSAASAQTTVTVNPIPATPTITAGGPTTFCAGGSVTLTSSSASGNQWYLNGVAIGSATNQTYSATASGNYTVIVTSLGCSSAASAQTTVTVNPIPATPTITAGGPTTFCQGGSVTLTSSSASGNQWYLNGVAIGSATNQTYNATASGNYTVIVTSLGCSSAASAQTTVTVNPIPATPTISAGGATTFCAGGSVTLTSSSASGNQWYLNGVAIGSATNQTYNATASGNYTVIVTSLGCSSAASAPTSVTVVAIPPAPTLSVPRSVAVGATGVTASVTNHPGNTYTWTLTGGTITGGQGTSTLTYNAGLPGTRMNLSVVETAGPGCASPAASTAQMVDFLDVPPSHPFHTFVIKIALAGITGGCGGGNFCPDSSVSRAQMAVFLLVGKHGNGYTPPPATGIFTDVPVGSFAANFIEELYNEGITGGCSANPLKYCPNDPVTRAQMAVFLLIAQHGSGYAPPPATGIFGDVPVGSFAASFIEQLYREGITGGCSSNPLLYCPTSSTSRGQMSVFLSVTFNLP